MCVRKICDRSNRLRPNVDVFCCRRNAQCLLKFHEGFVIFMAPSTAQCQNFAKVGICKANRLTVHTADGSMVCGLCNHTAVFSVQPHSSVVCATTQQCCCLCNHAAALLSVQPRSSVVVCATTQQCCCLCKHTAVHFASLYLLHFPSLSLPHPPHDSPTDLHSTMSLRYSLDRQYSDQLRHCRCLKANSVPWSQECRIHKRYLQRNFGFFLSFSTMSNEGGRHGGGCFYRLTVT